MKASEAKEIFQAMATANRHPDPAAYADKALEAWKNPQAAAPADEPAVEQEGE